MSGFMPAINYWAVLVAAVAYMVLGALWYLPAFFGNVWMKGLGKTKEQVQADHSAMNYIWAIVCAFVASYGIARIMLWTGGDSIVDGVRTAVLVGVCFMGSAFWVNDSFEGRPKGLTVINVLYHLVGMIVAGVIIGAWR